MVVLLAAFISCEKTSVNSGNEDNIEIMKDFTHNYTLETITDSKGEKKETTYDYDEKCNLKAY